MIKSLEICSDREPTAKCQAMCRFLQHVDLVKAAQPLGVHP
jgi:hypothetical protein